MKIYDELKARGLIAQVTDEELISNLINEGKATKTTEVKEDVKTFSPDSRQSSCGTFYGTVPDETSSDGRE